MKKTFSFRAAALAAILSGLLFSCTEHLWSTGADVSSDGCSDFTLAEVKRVFEADYAVAHRTRTDGMFDPDVVLAPVRIDPSWDSVSFGFGDADETIIQAEVPFEARYEYYLLRQNEDGTSSFSSMPSRLVVLKDTESDATASWLFFWLPDADCYYSDDGAGFSGVALYTTLAGIPVCVGRYSCGEFVGSASLSDESHSWEENAEALDELLQGICVARTRSEVATRNSEIAWSTDIEAVTIVARKPIKSPDPWEEEDLNMPRIVPEIETMNRLPLFGLQGGGSGSKSNVPNSYVRNSKITASKEICDILDELYEDCMGKRLINSITVEVQIDTVDTSGSRVLTDYYAETGTILKCKILMGRRRTDWVLMEEFIHIYQNLHGGCGTAKLNKEVEAKLGWYTYLKRNMRLDDTRDALGGWKGEHFFDAMWELLLKNDMKNPEFFENFENAAESLREITGYKNEKFDSNKMDCSDLLDLLKDCEYK